jgi:hypothetical protein
MQPLSAIIRSAATAVVIAAGVTTAGPALAQSAASDSTAFAGLGSRLRSGDRVTVTTPTLGTMKGRFVHVAEDVLVIKDEQGLRQIPASDVDRITRKRHGVLLGTLIGLGVGTALAVPLNMLFHSEGGDATAPTVFLVGVSTGIGVGIDALIDLPRTVYRRDRPMTMRVAPQVGPKAAGVALQVGF